MTVKITLHIEGLPAHQAEQVVRDALNEFVQNRTPVLHYVMTRYGHHPEDFRAEKVNTVNDRVAAAMSALGPMGHRIEAEELK